MKWRFPKVLSCEVLGIIRQGRGGGCCGRKNLPWMCHQRGRKPCAARRGASNQIAFDTTWRGSGRRSDKTLFSFFVRNQGQCLHDWRLCCDGWPVPFCGQPLLRSDLGGVGGAGRAFLGGRDGILLLWDLGRLCLGMAPGDADARGAGHGMVATAGLLAGFVPLINGPSRRHGCMAWLQGSSGGV